MRDIIDDKAEVETAVDYLHSTSKAHEGKFTLSDETLSLLRTCII